MNLVITNYKAQSKDSYLVTFNYGDEEFVSLIKIVDGVVPYTEYDVYLQDILHKGTSIN